MAQGSHLYHEWYFLGNPAHVISEEQDVMMRLLPEGGGEAALPQDTVRCMGGAARTGLVRRGHNKPSYVLLAMAGERGLAYRNVLLDRLCTVTC